MSALPSRAAVPTNGTPVPLPKLAPIPDPDDTGYRVVVHAGGAWMKVTLDRRDAGGFDLGVSSDADVFKVEIERVKPNE